MATSDQSTANPLTLLPRVLNHLKSLHGKPALANSVFATVRKVFRTSRSQPFITPLIPPLTIIALTSPLTNVRNDAAHTCAALFQALVSRRVNSLSAAYVEDLVALAQFLINSTAKEPPLCHLPTYCQLAKSKTNYNLTTESNTATLPITPQSLEAILHLLSQFLPTVDPQTDPCDFSNHASSQLASTRLWICIGTNARSRILDLAASYSVLSGRCGEGPSRIAILLLQKALNQSSTLALHAPSYNIIRITVEALLHEGFSPQIEDTAKRRRELYHIAQLASMENSLSPDLWTSCGIREASIAGALGEHLMKQSNQGLVRPYFQPVEESTRRLRSIEEPPKKRRRLSQSDNVNSNDDRDISTADTTQSHMGASHLAVAGLQRTLQNIESIYVCLEDASSMHLLGKSCVLTADSLNILGRDNVTSSKSFEEWITFATSLSLIARDLSTNLQTTLNRKIWVATLQFCEGIVFLTCALRNIRKTMANCVSSDPKVLDSTLAASNTLFAAFSAILANAAVALESVHDFPALELGELLAKVGDLALGRDFKPVEDDSFSNSVSKIQDFALKEEIFDTKSRASLIRGSIRSSFAAPVQSGGQLGTQAIPLLIDLLSTDMTATPEVIAAAASSLGDAVCITLGCRDRHDSQKEASNGGRYDSRSLEAEIWSKSCDAIEPYLKHSNGIKVTVGTLKCLGSLAVHSPSEQLRRIVSKLRDVLWSHDEELAQDLSYSYIREILMTRRGARALLGKEASTFDMESRSLTLRTADDSAVIKCHKNDDLMIHDFEQDFRKCMEKWSQEHKKGPQKAASGDSHRMALTMLLFKEAFSSRSLTGFSVSALLSSSMRDYCYIDDCFSNGTRNPEAIKEVALSKASSALTIWFHMVRAIASHTGFLSYQSDEINHDFRSRGDLFLRTFHNSNSPMPTLTEAVIIFLTSQFRDWLPVAVMKMLDDIVFTSALSQLLSDGDSKALWIKVPRYTTEAILKDQNMHLLDTLASKLQQSRGAIIERISADVLARFVMNQAGESDTSGTDSRALILNMFEQPLKGVLSKRAGKIVQKLVMEFGTSEEDRARRGLLFLSRMLSKGKRDELPSDKEAAGVLLSQHFMLVMDAVNRGLFHSKASPTDRFRYLRMLEVVIHVSSVQLHLFVPKILATLKLALQADRGDQAFHGKTLLVWMSFLKTLGPSRILPHLGSILSTLVPFYSTCKEILSPTVTSLVERCAGLQMNNRHDIVLLLKVTDHKELITTATALEVSANNVSSVRHGSQADHQMNVKQLSWLTRSVRNVITQLQNGTIEVLSAKYLLQMLQQSRELLSAAAAEIGHCHELKPSEEVTALASIAGSLVELLTKTKNSDCQGVLLNCIGEIGAIDPALVCQLYRDTGKEVEQKETALSMGFPTRVHALVAILLDDILVPTLTTGEQQNRSRSRQNRIGLVIQELLRVCGCEKNTAKRASKNPRTREVGNKGIEWDKVLVGETSDENAVFFWENLMPATRNIAEPYLDEPFDVQHYRGIFGDSAAGETKIACQPVWTRVKTANSAGQIPTAQEWRRQMIVQLVDYVGKRGTFGEVLKALRPVLRYEDDVTAFIFPLVIATTLDIQDKDRPSEVIRFITTEVAEVLNEGSSPQPLFDLFDALRKWRDQRCNEQARVTMMRNPGIINSAGHGAISSRRKVPMEAYAELEKDQDPLSAFVDLDGRESSALPLILQANSAFRAKSYSRAVMLAETYIRNMRTKKGFAGWPSFIEDILGRDGDNPDSLFLSEADALRLLQRAFAELEDSGNMEAISALRGNSSLAEQVLDCEAAGRYNEALTTYERAISSEPQSVQFYDGFLNCLMTLGHWESMLSHAKGLLSSSLSRNDLREVARANGIAAAWRLGRWTEMEELCDNAFDIGSIRKVEEPQRSSTLKVSIALGEMLRCLQSGKFSSLCHAASEARRHLLGLTVRAASEGYSRAYPMISLLHSISDVEDSCRLLEIDNGSALGNCNSIPKAIPSKTLLSFASRTESAKSSLKAREPLISIKRVCYELLNRPSDAALANLELARLARDGDNLHAATTSTHQAMSVTSINSHVRNEIVLEMAYIQRAQGDSSSALKTVKAEIERLTSVLSEERSQDTGMDFARETSNRLCKALVTAGCWLEETREEPSDVILSYFDRAAVFGPSREEPFYSLGRHYDSLLQASTNTDEKSARGSGSSSRPMRRSNGHSDHGVNHHTVYVPLIIKSFAQALVNGHTRIFEALPRMLTVWFDYNTELDDANGSGNAALVEHEVKQEMKRAFDSIPGYMWMTAVPQIMSRILHPKKQVREDLTVLLAKLVCIFPDQCFWTILPSSQLKCIERKRAAGNILNQAMALTKKKGKPSEAREKARVLRSRIQSALSVVNSFVNICTNLLPKEKRGRRENCGREFAEVKAYLRTNMSMNPIIPTLDSLTTRLPFREGKEHRPFEEEPVRIVDIEDHVLVMVSLMRPRRIGLVGSDGRCYKYLAKKENQGDMRKDSRLVELVTVVNRLLAKNASSRGKKLGLKTYAVLPLTEETGMIEWVNDLAPLRNVVRDEHNRIAVIPDTGQIQSKYQNLSHKKFLVDWAFMKFPPVLDKFFLRQFGEDAGAEAWLGARNVWTESTAVWSMVGYVVGLGDRHGENVLIETTSGRCVHVDFAMLFDKGLKLKVPEIVPFRLTRNMVTAMGIAGYEGVYRGVSEHVLGIMRRNADAVLGVLESFLHDPLADWGRSEARVNKGGILATKEAWQTRAAVKAKLTGMVDSSGLALSIKGQVQRLIQEATNVDNLCEMYLWWCAWT